MKKLKVFLLLIACLTFSTLLFAKNLKTNQNLSSWAFQIGMGKSKFVLDQSTVKKAYPIFNKGNFNGIVIMLNDAAAKKFVSITNSAQGQTMSLVINNKAYPPSIIQGSLVGNIVIPYVTQKQAQDFIHSLQTNRQNK